MKKFLLQAVFLLSIIMPLSAFSTGRADLERQTTRLSAQLVLKEWQNNLIRHPFPALESELYKQMRLNLPRCVQISAARAGLQADFTAAFRRHYREQVAQLLQPLMSNLSSQEQNRLLNPPPRYIQQGCAQIYPAVFERARHRLAAEQRTKLFQEIYPSTSELEQLSDPELISLLEKRFTARLPEPLLQENQALLQKSVIVPAIKRGRQQQKQQLQLLSRLTVPAELWERAAVQQHLSAELQKHWQSQSKPGQFQFGIFPQTRQKIAEIATALPATRAVAALPSTLELDFYRQKIEAAPAEHHDLPQSLRRVLPQFQEMCTEAAFSTAGVPAQYQPQLRQDQQFTRAVTAHIHHQIVPKLKTIRHQVAQEWVKKHFSELSSGAWQPTPEAVEKFAVSPQNLPQVAAAPWSEADAFIKKLQRQALNCAVQNLKQQQQVVEEVYDQVAEHCRDKSRPINQVWWKKLFDWSSKELKIADIVQLYRQAVVEKLPPKTILFPTVNQEIDWRSRAIWQLLQQEKTSVFSPEPLQISLVLTQAGNQLKLQGDAWQCQAPVECPEILFSAVQEQLQNHLQRCSPSTNIQLNLIVKSPRLAYCTVARLREKLQNQLRNRGYVRDFYQDK